MQHEPRRVGVLGRLGRRDLREDCLAVTPGPAQVAKRLAVFEPQSRKAVVELLDVDRPRIARRPLPRGRAIEVVTGNGVERERATRVACPLGGVEIALAWLGASVDRDLARALLVGLAHRYLELDSALG